MALVGDPSWGSFYAARAKQQAATAAPAAPAPITPVPAEPAPAIPAAVAPAPVSPVGGLSSPTPALNFAGSPTQPSPGYHSGILATDTDNSGWNNMAAKAANPNALPSTAFHTEPRGFGPTNGNNGSGS